MRLTATMDEKMAVYLVAQSVVETTVVNLALNLAAKTVEMEGLTAERIVDWKVACYALFLV